MIKIVTAPISAEQVINEVKTGSSGCVVSYVGVIRDYSRNKPVRSVEYEDADGRAVDKLREIAEAMEQKWPLNGVAIYHRIGLLNVGEVNLVVAIAAAHREEGFAACQYAINQFKEKLPTRKTETYQDGSVRVDDKS